MRIGFHSIKVHNVLTEIRYDSTEINKIRYNRTAFMLSRVRGERVMADMVQDNLCCSRSVVDWPKVTRSLLGAVSFLVIGLLVLYGMSKQGIHDIFPYFFHRNRHCEPASLQGERQRIRHRRRKRYAGVSGRRHQSPKLDVALQPPLSVSGIHEA